MTTTELTVSNYYCSWPHDQLLAATTELNELDLLTYTNNNYDNEQQITIIIL
jgi:hypothetical protein